MSESGAMSPAGPPGPTEWGENPGVGPWQGPPPDDPRYDAALLRDGDTRNVVDAYRYWTREAIIADIDARRHPLHIAIENFGNDANIGAVVRTANAFAVDTVHIVGRRRWNRRGAMVTDRYQRLRHHDTTAELLAFAADARLTVVAVDNVPGAARLESTSPAAGVPVDIRSGGTGHHRRRQGGCRRSRCPSPSSARPAASTPASPPASPCTPGSLDMGTFRRPGRAGSKPWISYGPTALPAPRPRSPRGI